MAEKENKGAKLDMISTLKAGNTNLSEKKVKKIDLIEYRKKRR